MYTCISNWCRVIKPLTGIVRQTTEAIRLRLTNSFSITPYERNTSQPSFLHQTIQATRYNLHGFIYFSEVGSYKMQKLEVRRWKLDYSLSIIQLRVSSFQPLASGFRFSSL